MLAAVAHSALLHAVMLHTGVFAAHARIEANERVMEERWAGLEFRLGQIDAALERLERRIWLGVYGVAGFLLAQGAEAVIRAAMK